MVLEREEVTSLFFLKTHVKDKSSYSTLDSGIGGNLNSSSSESSLEVNLEDEVKEEARLVPEESPCQLLPPFWDRIIGHCQMMFTLFVGALRCILLRLRLETNHLGQEREDMCHFTPLYSMWDPMFTLFIVRRVRDVMYRPVCSCPGTTISINERTSDDYGWTFKLTGRKQHITNIGSYNYLGFASNSGPCAESALEAVTEHGVSTGGVSSQSLVVNSVHGQLERSMAKFLGVQDCVVFPMGFATNSMAIPSLINERCLVLSDQLNHCSLIVGCKLSKATIKVFNHNDVSHCERLIVQALARGHPKTGQPFTNILVIIEGLYSMEGTIPPLLQFIELRNKYKIYLMMDEAHSIGSMGHTGRGVCEYWGVSTEEVDILMGTFTKTMAGAGGYMAGSRELMQTIRHWSHACYAPLMSPPVCQQAITALQVLDSRRGAEMLSNLRWNTRYFRRGLREAGFVVIGHHHSPVVPVLITGMSKIAEFSRQLLNMNIGIVVVAYPAIPLAAERVRFCLSGGHTRAQLDNALRCVTQVADQINARYLKGCQSTIT